MLGAGTTRGSDLGAVICVKVCGQALDVPERFQNNIPWNDESLRFKFDNDVSASCADRRHSADKRSLHGNPPQVAALFVAGHGERYAMIKQSEMVLKMDLTS